jgi:hypothetical protein
MGDKELYSNPEEGNAQSSEGHEQRVREAFGSLHQSLGERASKRDEERVLGIRDAVATGNRAQAEEHLTAVKTESSWLYDELMKHPEISGILRELSIMGF